MEFCWGSRRNVESYLRRLQFHRLKPGLHAVRSLAVEGEMEKLTPQSAEWFQDALEIAGILSEYGVPALAGGDQRVAMLINSKEVVHFKRLS